MKIEITDKQKWIGFIDAELQRIEARRSDDDVKYVKRWREAKNIFGKVRKDRADKLPPENRDIFELDSYPSTYGHWWERDIIVIKKALQVSGAGSAYITEKEMLQILPPQ